MTITQSIYSVSFTGTLHHHDIKLHYTVNSQQSAPPKNSLCYHPQCALLFPKLAQWIILAHDTFYSCLDVPLPAEQCTGNAHSGLAVSLKQWVVHWFDSQ